MAVSPTSKYNYTGTLIFCIIATVVTLAIIALFFLVDVDSAKYMLLTIEICLVIIVLHSVISIVMYDRATREYTNDLSNAPLPEIPCPDYFTRSNENGTTYCENVYDTNKTYITIGPQLTQIDMTTLNKQIAIEACNMYRTEHEGNIPWTDLKSTCETIV